MKRRRFLQAIAAAPAVPLAAQQAAPPAVPPAAPQAAPNPPAPAPAPARVSRSQPEAPLETTAFDLTAQAAAPSFFTADQYAALRALGNLLQPAMNGHPGALEAGAPEFLDFLIGASPPDRQKLYREGLDALNSQAKKQFKRLFADLDAAQADAIVRPLLVVIPWSEDLPQDKVRHFIAQAHRDLRTATQNSREWATGGASSGRRGGRGFGGGTGLYWLPVDPVVRG
jgi:hypothetical protein